MNKFIVMIGISFVAPKVAARHELLFNKQVSEVGLNKIIVGLY